LYEPIELLIVEVPEEYVGAVMMKIGARRGELENMGTREGGSTHLEFRIPARGLIGYRGEFMTDTKGNGILNTSFEGYAPYKGDIQYRKQHQCPRNKRLRNIEIHTWSNRY
jgi:GTP-binding protein